MSLTRSTTADSVAASPTREMAARLAYRAMVARRAATAERIGRREATSEIRRALTLASR